MYYKYQFYISETLSSSFYYTTYQLVSESFFRFCENMSVLNPRIAVFKGRKGFNDYELYIGPM